MAKDKNPLIPTPLAVALNISIPAPKKQKRADVKIVGDTVTFKVPAIDTVITYSPAWVQAVRDKFAEDKDTAELIITLAKIGTKANLHNQTTPWHLAGGDALLKAASDVVNGYYANKVSSSIKSPVNVISNENIALYVFAELSASGDIDSDDLWTCVLSAVAKVKDDRATLGDFVATLEKPKVARVKQLGKYKAIRGIVDFTLAG
jgi:hypothetical protein